MELTVGILVEELFSYNPIVYKSISNKAKFSRIQSFDPEDTKYNPSTLYLVDDTSFDVDFSHNYPNHILFIGCEISQSFAKNADTVLLISKELSLEKLFQILMDLWISYENWSQDMLLAIIENKSIDEFIEIAIQKLKNPVAIFDNSMTLITSAGEFQKPSKGTIWDIVGNSEYTITNFFTLQEQLEYSTKAVSNKGEPYVYHPSTDKDHTYVTSHIWINNKLYANLGSVDINAPFSNAQLDLIRHVTKCLKLFFSSNDTYMSIIEDNTNFLKNLLEDNISDEKIISYHLKKLSWDIYDHFYVVNFHCPLPFNTPIESISYKKYIHHCFQKSLIMVYKDSIILIVRHKDYPIQHQLEKQKLEQLLNEKNMKCGISACFNNFMLLKQYYIQSYFALEFCKQQTDISSQHYQDCHENHIMHLLKSTTDLRCLCHPLILSIWNSHDQNNHQLINCLYHYLLNGRSLSLTSKALHIHRNTLIYRINKISQILEVDLKNISSKELFYFLFSCMLVQHL
ncbi:MAG: PucR family transcriptional regulator [Eubacteriaceae bacterium]